MKNKSSPKTDLRDLKIHRADGFTLVEAWFENHETAPHAYEGFSLSYTETGWEHLECGTHQGPVAARSFVLIPPELIHRDRSGFNGPCHTLSLYFPKAFPELEGVHPRETVFQSQRLKEAMDQAVEKIRKANDASACADLSAALLRETRWIRKTRQPPPLIATPPVSRFAALRAFKVQYGCTPGEYDRQARVRQAAELLLKGLSPADAAVEAGFFDQSHLHRHFLRIYEVPPAEFAKRNGVQDPETPSG